MMANKKGLTLKDLFVALAVITLAAYLGLHEKNKPTPQQPLPSTIKGRAIIIDGDTLTINNTRIRLLGIDAPELHQKCGEPDKLYDCGKEAKNYLVNLIKDNDVECRWNKKDQYQRILAVCLVDHKALNPLMVTDGWAVSYYDYKDEEKEAKMQKRGLWAHPFERPRQWRDKNPH